MDVAARRRDEIGVRLHQRVFARADHPARLFRQRAVDRHEVGGAQQVGQLHLLGAARRDLLFGQIGIAGEHAHAEEAARELGDAAADVAEADDAEGLARHVVADEAATIEVLLAPHRAVDLDDALGEAQHHADDVLGHRFAVAARLVDHEHARLRAFLHVDGVVARAVGRHDQQVGRAREQRGGGVEPAGELVARRADLVGVRRFENGRRHLVGAVVLQLVEPHVRPPRQRVDVIVRRQVLHIEHALGIAGHRGILDCWSGERVFSYYRSCRRDTIV